MHEGMPYGRNQGQGQGHSREVDRQSPTGLIFENCQWTSRQKSKNKGPWSYTSSFIYCLTETPHCHGTYLCHCLGFRDNLEIMLFTLPTPRSAKPVEDG